MKIGQIKAPDETFIQEWLDEAGIDDPIERAAIRDELFPSTVED